MGIRLYKDKIRTLITSIPPLIVTLIEYISMISFTLTLIVILCHQSIRIQRCLGVNLDRPNEKLHVHYKLW